MSRSQPASDPFAARRAPSTSIRSTARSAALDPGPEPARESQQASRDPEERRHCRVAGGRAARRPAAAEDQALRVGGGHAGQAAPRSRGTGSGSGRRGCSCTTRNGGAPSGRSPASRATVRKPCSRKASTLVAVSGVTGPGSTSPTLARVRCRTRGSSGASAATVIGRDCSSTGPLGADRPLHVLRRAEARLGARERARPPRPGPPGPRHPPAPSRAARGGAVDGCSGRG